MTVPTIELAVPERVEGLDLGWFRALIAASKPGVELEAVEITEVIDSTCTKLRCRMRFAGPSSGELPADLLLKGGFADHSHLFVEMHETELRWYRDIAPSTPFDTPACFATVRDPDSRRSAVLLEDLDARAVHWLGAREPLGWAQTARFVDALAALAARWWLDPDLQPDGRLEWVIHSYEKEALAYIEHNLTADRWDAFMRLPRATCLPRRLLDREAMRRALAVLGRRLSMQPLTLSHGDAHPGNLYLTADGAPGFLDAQPRRAPWVKDFAYQMVASLDIEDRRAWERPLLSRYLRKLTDGGVRDAPSFEEAWYDYRCELAYGLFIFLINESHFQREEINTACAARFGAAAIDHDTFDLLR